MKKEKEMGNNMLTIAICEDQPEDMSYLRRLLAQSEISCTVSSYTSAEALLEDLENHSKQFDIYFLDIYLPDQTGIDLAQRLRRENDAAILIFLSASDSFYREAFDLYAFHYFLKPIQLPELQSVLQRAARLLDKQTDSFLPICFRGQNIRLRQADISYIASANHRLHFHMRGGRQYTIYRKLDDIETMLSPSLFVRCHKSFIVNLNQVTRLTPEGFYLGDKLIGISRSYSAQAKVAYHDHLFGVFYNV